MVVATLPPLHRPVRRDHDCPDADQLRRGAFGFRGRSVIYFNWGQSAIGIGGLDLYLAAQHVSVTVLDNYLMGQSPDVVPQILTAIFTAVTSGASQPRPGLDLPSARHNRSPLPADARQHGQHR